MLCERGVLHKALPALGTDERLPLKMSGPVPCEVGVIDKAFAAFSAGERFPTLVRFLVLL